MNIGRLLTSGEVTITITKQCVSLYGSVESLTLTWMLYVPLFSCVVVTRYPEFRSVSNRSVTSERTSVNDTGPMFSHTTCRHPLWLVLLKTVNSHWLYSNAFSQNFVNPDNPKTFGRHSDAHHWVRYCYRWWTFWSHSGLWSTRVSLLYISENVLAMLTGSGSTYRLRLFTYHCYLHGMSRDHHGPHPQHVLSQARCSVGSFVEQRR